MVRIHPGPRTRHGPPTQWEGRFVGRLAGAGRGIAAELHAPALCDVEVVSVLRRGLLARLLSARRAAEAVSHYLLLPLRRHGHMGLLERILSLRHNFSAYDASYVALAELLDAEIVTADAALAQAIRTHSRLRVLSA